MSLHTVNLNLIPVLRELLHRRSISAAALALGRSSSAISQGLTQLRVAFDDPLLVRAGGKMVLTPRATDLIGPVEEACAGMERVLHVDRFTPGETARVFVIAASDYHCFLFGPSLLAAFRKIAPAMHIRFVELSRDLTARMIAREVDFAVMPDFLLGELTSDRLRHHFITAHRTVALMRDGHPLSLESCVSHEQLMAFPHIGYYPSWEVMGRQSNLLAFRRSFTVVAYSSQMTVVPFYLPGTDYIALVPVAIAEHIGANIGLIHRPLSFDEKAINSILAWSPVQDADPAHRWFRKLAIATICQPPD